MEIRWKINGIFKADANLVAGEIGEKATPEQVLEKARDESTELHKCFEWNDSVAAEKYRLDQARKIIQMLVVVPEKKEHSQVRHFSLTQEKGVYQQTKLFLKNEDEYQALLNRAMRELQAFKEKYHTLTELESVFDAIDEL